MKIDIASLQNLIGQYRAFDAVERFYQETVLRLLAAHGSAALSRSFFQPGHITTSAWVTTADYKSTLLINHAKSGKWFQPGGHVEPDDETLLAGALREVREECGFILDCVAEPVLFDIDTHGINRHKNEPDHLHFDCRFLVRLPVASPIRLDDPTAVPAAQWVSLEEVATLMPREPSTTRLLAKTNALIMG